MRIIRVNSSYSVLLYQRDHDYRYQGKTSKSISFVGKMFFVFFSYFLLKTIGSDSVFSLVWRPEMYKLGVWSWQLYIKNAEGTTFHRAFIVVCLIERVSAELISALLKRRLNQLTAIFACLCSVSGLL